MQWVSELKMLRGEFFTHFLPSPSRFNDSDHLKDPDLYSDKSDRECEQDHEESDPEGLEKSEESDSDTSERQDDSYVDLDPNEHLRETPYLEQSHEELGEVGGRRIARTRSFESFP